MNSTGFHCNQFASYIVSALLAEVNGESVPSHDETKVLTNVLSYKCSVIKLYLAGTVPIYPCCLREVSIQFIIYEYPEGQSHYNNALAAVLFYYDS